MIDGCVLAFRSCCLSHQCSEMSDVNTETQQTDSRTGEDFPQPPHTHSSSAAAVKCLKVLHHSAAVTWLHDLQFHSPLLSSFSVLISGSSPLSAGHADDSSHLLWFQTWCSFIFQHCHTHARSICEECLIWFHVQKTCRSLARVCLSECSGVSRVCLALIISVTVKCVMFREICR